MAHEKKHNKKRPPGGELFDLAIDAETGLLEPKSTIFEYLELGAGRAFAPAELLRIAQEFEAFADHLRTVARERSAA